MTIQSAEDVKAIKKPTSRSADADGEESGNSTCNEIPIPRTTSNTGKTIRKAGTRSWPVGEEASEDVSLSYPPKGQTAGSGVKKRKDIIQPPRRARTMLTRRWTNNSVLPSIREWRYESQMAVEAHLRTSPSATANSQSQSVTRDYDLTSNQTGSTPSTERASMGHNSPSLPLLSPVSRIERSLLLNTDIQEACLLRYFVENLARWFDLCDPQRHFATIVPERARSCPPLLNAILTAAARHMYRLDRYKTSHGIKYRGLLLPNLSAESAIHYQNECIPHLIHLSNNVDQVRNENLLAAAVILRFYEEVDAPLSGGSDSGVFLHVINLFIEAQVLTVSPIMDYQAIPDSVTNSQSADIPQTVQSPFSDPTRYRTDAAQANLRQAAFWVFLRQEIYNAFIKQRSIHFCLRRCEAFRSLSSADDSIWADRLVVFCADVLQYCHGPEVHTVERWEKLKTFLTQLVNSLPLSFHPIHFHPTETTNQASVLASIWYLADCHAIGAQYIELSRMLLTVYDPAIPRLGPGAVAAQTTLAADLRKIVLRLCSIALSNEHVAPGLVTACMGIAMCGEYFTDYDEQVALLGVLEKMERDHGWPTEGTGVSLERVWGWV